MNSEDEQKLSELALQLNSLTSVLCGYCENYMESSKEINNLVEFAELLNKTAFELYDLFWIKLFSGRMGFSPSQDWTILYWWANADKNYLNSALYLHAHPTLFTQFLSLLKHFFQNSSRYLGFWGFFYFLNV